MNKDYELRRVGIEQGANVLQERVNFWWDKEPTDNWAGFSRADLTDLVGDISKIIGITESEAAKIEVYFADDTTPLVNGQKNVTSAICLPHREETGRYDRVYVIFNRSKEIVEYLLDKRQIINIDEQSAYQESGILHEVEGQEPIDCELVTPFEVIVSTIAEELKHAQVALKAGDGERMSNWEKRYLASLQKREFKTSDIYDVSLQEVAASRASLKVLEILLRDKFPERTSYFHQAHEQSVKEGRGVVPALSDDVIAATFIKTRFDPKDINEVS